MCVNNGNRTEWTAICSEIIQLIRRACSAFTSMILDQNCMTRSSITIYSHFETTEFSEYKYFY